ncbi:general stress protein [Demetria terragena]|uniref:general stress protein n=1 Tax=Demetria terragena TaxID=63959 RepID=UPI001B7FEBD2|nr:general stress protein [Demetria terragena]
MSNSAMTPRAGQGALTLDYPMSLGVYDDYVHAQQAVDYLSDHEFPVENCLIVGTDLKQVERVMGRLTWRRVLAGGALSGLWLGLFVGLIFTLFGSEDAVSTLFSTMLLGVVFGIGWAAVGYAVSRGQRDFTSVSRVVATRYEVLVEHKFAERGRDLLAQMAGGPRLTN